MTNNDPSNAKVYRPSTAVWEITYDCNMRCQHCGSSCTGPKDDELSTEEALELCDSIAALGVRHITLSGGEPLTRKDWPQLVQRLSDHGLSVGILSNGWMMDEATAKVAKESGLSVFGVSIDGLPETHDRIRKAGSYERIEKAIAFAKSQHLYTTAVTCIHALNLPELAGIKERIKGMGVDSWQLQAAEPMGNLLAHPEWLLPPSAIEEIIDFAYATQQEKRIRVYLAENLGYYSLKEIEVHHHSTLHDPSQMPDFEPDSEQEQSYKLWRGAWRGCSAGKSMLGIRCNGDISGCLSIRDDNYIEGSTRKHTLHEIWHRPGAFAWNRERSKADLQGRCRICQFGSLCLGACSGTKITRCNGCLAENPFCSYHHAMENLQTATDAIPEDQLRTKAEEAVKRADWQSAEQILRRACSGQKEDVYLLNLLGFVNYKLENYPECLENNEKALSLDPDNAYAFNGRGNCLAKMGRVEEGIASIKRAMELAGPDGSFKDPWVDLARIYKEQGLAVTGNQ